jgi:hypothetical protein
VQQRHERKGKKMEGKNKTVINEKKEVIKSLFKASQNPV